MNARLKIPGERNSGPARFPACLGGGGCGLEKNSVCRAMLAAGPELRSKNTRQAGASARSSSAFSRGP